MIMMRLLPLHRCISLGRRSGAREPRRLQSLAAAVPPPRFFRRAPPSRCSLSTKARADGDGTDGDASLFARDELFPPPTDASLAIRGVPLLARAAHHASAGRTLAYDVHDGVIDDGRKKKISYSYRDVLDMSTHLHGHFVEQRRKQQERAASNDPAGGGGGGGGKEPPPRIAFLCPPGPLYVATQFAAWSSGSIAVPLCASHKSKELAYVLRDCDPELVIDGAPSLSGGRELRTAARDAGVMDRYWCLDDAMASFVPREGADAEDHGQDQNRHRYALGSGGDVPGMDSPALIIYTSGTTGNPKGVVHTHRNLYHQVTDLVVSWGWTEEDSILHFLPLHHVQYVCFVPVCLLLLRRLYVLLGELVVLLLTLEGATLAHLCQRDLALSPRWLVS